MEGRRANALASDRVRRLRMGRRVGGGVGARRVLEQGMNKNTAMATTMTPAGVARADDSGPGAAWTRTSLDLRHEIGDDAFGSWLAPARLRLAPGGELCLVTPTGVAKDWIRRYAWRRIGELWAIHAPAGRALTLKTRQEFDADGGADPGAAEAPTLADTILDFEVPAPSLGTPPVPGPASGCRASALQERFTFDTFVCGPSNAFAHAVARRVASWTDGHFNPVVFHGPYGFGKTHLLNALAWEAMRTAPDRKVVYLTSERFLSGFIEAVTERRMPAFKDELRSADLLLVDDVHFIGGKHSTQEELFHTLAALMEDGRRVVLSADRPAAALTELDGRLRSHLSAGLVCGVEPADRALRLGILDRKVAAIGRRQGFAGALKPDVAAFLADRFCDSVRELEGALNVLIAREGAGVADLTLDAAQNALRPHLRVGERRVTVDEIQKAVAEHFGLKQADLNAQGRARAIARPRQAGMWLAKQLTTRSLPDIGRRFGGRDHTTVLHAVRRIDQLRAADAQLARDLDILLHKLRD
jgi:chromosomal replication initiator protein